MPEVLLVWSAAPFGLLYSVVYSSVGWAVATVTPSRPGALLAALRNNLGGVT